MNGLETVQRLQNRTYVELTSATRVQTTGAAGDFRVSAIQDDASNLSVSAKSSDAGTMRVSAIQEDAVNLMVSAKSDDAGLMRVSALGVNIADVSNDDAADFRVSCFSDNASQLRVSSFIDSGSVSAVQGDASNLRVSTIQEDATNHRISAIQDNATNLNVSAKSDDGSLFRTSSIIDSGRVSAIQPDASNLMVSAKSDNASLLRTSAFVDSGSISAMQSDAANLRTSAIQDDASNLNVSAKSNDAGTFRTSSLTLGKISSGAYRIIELDDSTEATTTIHYEHHEIHAGSHYCVTGYDELNAGDNVDFLFETPDTTKWVHLLFDIQSSNEMIFEIYEGVSAISGGTSTTPLNNNRNSSNESLVSVTKNPTSFNISAGTLIESAKWGSRQFGGSLSRGNELILKQNEIYAFRLSSSANNNIISYSGCWYEHTDKN